MTQKWYEKVRSLLHFNDNSRMLQREHPDFDRLFKVRPLIDTLNQTFGSLSYEQTLSVDELMCSTKMRSHLKQHLPSKPHKRGVKLFILTDTQGFAHKF